ncbi:acetylcholine receptor subunit delta-like [Aplysia californica]|uniref:Acetylcholine receptor subunit delta-like n=1 Tax=Aplysia californica TaxID=6500 RepID=A0ABM1A624_APLCA|nr:acetylcholine receptor subunit delta-like [Aplysia californica]
MALRYFTTIVLLVLTSSLPTPVAMTSPYDDYIRLYKDMTTGQYDSRARPVLNQSHTLTVYVQFHIISLLAVNEVDETMDLNGWVNFTWFDEVRTWNPANYSNIYILRPNPLDMWRPRSLIGNSVAKRDVFDDDYMPAFIRNDGLSNWSPGAIFSTSCRMDFTYFPFDKQECAIMFVSYNSQREVCVLADEDGGRNENYTTNGEWDVLHIKHRQAIRTLNPDLYSIFEVVINLERKPKFFVINMIFPIVFMSALNSLVFVLPETSGERASFSTTMFLSLTLFMGAVTEHLPQRSDTFPVIVFYIFSLLILNGACVVATVVQLRFSPQPDNTLTTPSDSNDKTDSTKGQNADDIIVKKAFRGRNVVTPTDSFNKKNLFLTQLGSNPANNNIMLETDLFCITTNSKSPGNNFKSENVLMSQNSFLKEKNSTHVQASCTDKSALFSSTTNAKSCKYTSCFSRFRPYLTNVNVVLFTVYVLAWAACNIYFLNCLINQQ